MARTLLISRTPSSIAADTAAAGEATGLRRKTLFHLLEYSGRATPAIDPDRAGSLYGPVKNQLFERVIVGASVRLWRGQWAESFILNAFRQVAPGGVLATPFLQLKNGWPQQTLEAILQSPLHHEQGWFTSSVKGFRRDTLELPEVQSTLSWYLANSAGVLDSVLAEANDEPARESLRKLLDGQLADPPLALQNAISGQAYYVGGIGYKAPAIIHILQTLQGIRSRYRLVDVGGGYGLLAMELLLDRSLDLTEAITVDISIVNQKLAGLLARCIPTATEKRFSFVLSDAVDYAFLPATAAISFVGSLLYVPKPMRVKVVASAFAALEPGGVLIVHENIRAPSYVKDYDIMFEPAELDELLSAHGTVRYFSSTTPKELSATQSGRASVFRAVVKNG